MNNFINNCMKAMAVYVENMDRINHPSYYNSKKSQIDTNLFKR